MNNFFKKFLGFVEENIFFNHKAYLIEKEPRIQGKNEDNSIESIIFNSKANLIEHIENGYDLGEFSILTDLSEKFFRSQLLFGIFYNKILVHICYLIIEDKIEFFPPMKINFDEEAYIHFAITDPEYRGNGFYSKNLQMISDFSAKLGKKKLKMAVSKENLSSIKAAENSGFEIAGEARYMMLLKLIYWKEKYYK